MIASIDIQMEQECHIYANNADAGASDVVCRYIELFRVRLHSS